MKDQIRKQIQSAISKLYPEAADIDFTVEAAPEATGADYASNVAMVLAKKLARLPAPEGAADGGQGMKPMDVASVILNEVKDLDSSSPSAPQNDKMSVTVAAPGFLNFTLPEDTLHKNLREIIQQGEVYGALPSKRQEKVLVEYFQPNIAKPLHVGHMRSAIIGDCLYRTEKLFSETVESDTHMGDWGPSLAYCCMLTGSGAMTR